MGYIVRTFEYIEGYILRVKKVQKYRGNGIQRRNGNSCVQYIFLRLKENTAVVVEYIPCE